MSELTRMRMELKADIELIAIRQGDMAASMERIGTRVDEHGNVLADHGEQIAEQGRQIAEQGRQIAEQGRQIAEQGRRIAAQSEAINAQAEAIHAMSQDMRRQWKETARLSFEVADGQRWMQGRLRLLGERFDAVLGAVAKDYEQDHDLLMDLRVRVERLEQDRPPAA